MLVAVVASPGCSQTEPCSGGETYWTCHVEYMDKCQVAPDGPNITIPSGACASSAASAEAAVAVALMRSKRMVISITNCTNTYSLYPPMAATPDFVLKAQDVPSCLVFAGDNPCVSCAKTSCCNQYQACFSDASCTCLATCLYQGNSTAVCTSTDYCGAASDVSVSTAACLDSACATPVCPTAGDMLPGLCVDSTGGMGGSASTTPPACTPGSFGAGESCFSNGDCLSCVCNNDFCN